MENDGKSGLTDARAAGNELFPLNEANEMNVSWRKWVPI